MIRIFRGNLAGVWVGGYGYSDGYGLGYSYGCGYDPLGNKYRYNNYRELVT